MKFFALLFKKNNPADSLTYDQAVLIEFILGDRHLNSQAAIQFINDLERTLTSVLPDKAHIDGHDVGGDEVIIYIYGHDANVIWHNVEPIIKSSAIDRCNVTLQFGPPDDANTIDQKFTIP